MVRQPVAQASLRDLAVRMGKKVILELCPVTAPTHARLSKNRYTPARRAGQGGFVRRFLHSLLTLLVLATSLAVAAPAAAPVAAQATDERFFQQTGFRIDNDAIWSYFNQRDGVRTFGYPISRTFRFLGFQTQLFQRKLVQIGPNGNAQLMNVLDSGLMGFATSINFSPIPAHDEALATSAPAPGSPGYGQAIVEFIRANAPDVYQNQPVSFFQTFQTTVACDIAFPNQPCQENLLPLMDLEMWGSVTSRPLVDPNNRNFIYLRFQRGVMHFQGVDPNGQPIIGGTLLGTQFKSLLTGKDLPADLEQEARSANSPYLRQYCPGQPLSICRPDQLPQTDLTNAFEQQQPGAASTFGYGFQAHLWYFNPQAKGLVAGLVRQAGFNWMKHQVEWSAVETAPAQYDWSELDAIVGAAQAEGLHVLLSVAHAPGFYRSPASGLMPADAGTFQTFMQALAARYQGRVQAYELWNEENLDREAGTGNVDPSHYLPLLKAGYQGVKAGDPSALALLGAPSPTGANIPGVSMDDLSYLQQLYALNGGEAKQYFDALSAHPSGFSNPPDCTPSTPQCSLSGGWNDHPSFFAFYRISQYRDVMVQNGDSAKKIWFTEFGYGSTDQPVPGYGYATSVSEQQQGEFLVRAFQKARDLGYVGGMIVWNLNYQMFLAKTDEKWAFGVIRQDWSPRPAYSALANMPK